MHHHQDTNTLRSDALFALRDAFDDPSVLDAARVGDFDPAHRFGDRTAPALRVGPDGGWVALDRAAGDVLARYVEHLRPFGADRHLFATDDVDADRPPLDADR